MCMMIVAECTRLVAVRTGSCRAMFHAFYFNRLTNRCEEFICEDREDMSESSFSGKICSLFPLHLDNANWFETEKECLTKCGQENQINPEDQ